MSATLLTNLCNDVHYTLYSERRYKICSELHYTICSKLQYTKTVSIVAENSSIVCSKIVLLIGICKYPNVNLTKYRQDLHCYNLHNLGNTVPKLASPAISCSYNYYTIFFVVWLTR